MIKNAGDFIVKLLEILLKFNIFEFDGQLYSQNIGTAMGSRPAPAFANLFMAKKIDNQIINILNNFQVRDILNSKFFKRFLDDLFFVITGSTKVLHLVLEEINNIHPNISFTMEHTSILENDP